jgi:hypothetical protein
MLCCVILYANAHTYLAEISEPSSSRRGQRKQYATPACVRHTSMRTTRQRGVMYAYMLKCMLTCLRHAGVA